MFSCLTTLPNYLKIYIYTELKIIYISEMLIVKFWERLESKTSLKPQVETRRLSMAERYSFSVYVGGITLSLHKRERTRGQLLHEAWFVEN